MLEGIPYFLAERRYWCNLPADRVLEINRYIEAHGWDRALLEKFPAYLRAYVGGTGRDDARFFLPIQPDAVVLDLGCMWGTLTIALAEHCACVVGVDQTWETLRMADLRRESVGVPNATFLGAAAPRLPFKNGTFDVVLLNGVLEWVGVEREYVVERDWGRRPAQGGGRREPTASPRAIQLRVLREAWRVLRPGGVVFIAIENRYSGLYAVLPDDHTGLRYTSLMPRKLADWYMRIRRGEGYRTYTYSASALRQLLAEAGFARTRVYTAFPDYGQPDVVMPLEQRFLRFYGGRLARMVRTKLLLALTGRGLPATPALWVARLGATIVGWLVLIGVAKRLVPSLLAVAAKDGSAC